MQYILLTDDNKLWLWGFRRDLNHSGAVVANALTSIQYGYSYPFQQVIPDNNSGRSLPNGVNATDIKMLFVTWGTIAITTCDGAVWVLSQNDHIAQGNAATEWVRIHKANSADAKGDPLSNVVATRGSAYALMALTADGKVYTWGKETRLGNGTAPSNRYYAREMSLPNNANGTVKMIGATSYDKNNPSSLTTPSLDNGKHSYYILYQTAGKNYGELWALGNNEKKQLGNWSTSSSNSWVQPRYDSASGPVMNDIVWISPQEHDMLYPFINVINQEQYLFNWGAEAQQALGRGTHNVSIGSSEVDPGKPSTWSEGSNEDIMGVESGGHTTMIIRKCSSTFGYLGHRVHGSMGDGEIANIGGVAEVLFNTYPLQLCGIPTIDATLKANRGGPYCKNIPIQLDYAPLGG
ncbi:MAG TPA: hypothetical protein VK031_01400, partial [Tissierellaceae bacterium]|nr:hypothetical protein [Tissierellaceae bacterium]